VLSREEVRLEVVQVVLGEWYSALGWGDAKVDDDDIELEEDGSYSPILPNDVDDPEVDEMMWDVACVKSRSRC